MGMKLLGGRRVRWAVVVPLVALLGCLALSIVVYRFNVVCTPESRAALGGFPAFGDADIDPQPNNLTGSEGDCNASFTTTASADRVLDYYRQNLSARGWAVRDVPYEDLTGAYGGPTPEPGMVEMRGIVGERGDLCYYITHHADSSPVSVAVRRTDSGSKYAPPGRC